MESAGHAAAALVLSDAMDQRALDVALWPWRALRSGRPGADPYGPATDGVRAIIAESKRLLSRQADSLVTAWARPMRNQVLAWRKVASDDWPGPAGPPTFKLARASLRRELRWAREVDDVLVHGHVEVPLERRVMRASFYQRCLSNAVRDALLATVAQDALDPDVAALLAEPWRRRNDTLADRVLLLAVLGNRG